MLFFFRHPSSLLRIHNILGRMFKHSDRHRGHNSCTNWSSFLAVHLNKLYLLVLIISNLFLGPLRRCSAFLAPWKLRLRHHPRGLAPHKWKPSFEEEENRVRGIEEGKYPQQGWRGVIVVVGRQPCKFSFKSKWSWSSCFDFVGRQAILIFPLQGGMTSHLSLSVKQFTNRNDKTYENFNWKLS